MSPEVLETYIRDYCAAQHTPEISMAWQGGEPTLLGVDYFRRVVELQKNMLADARFPMRSRPTARDWTRSGAGFSVRTNFLSA
jgi:hypothetical protein